MAGVCEVRSEERVHYISAAQLQHYFITFLSSAFRPRSPRVPESVGAAELRTQHMLGARRSHHTSRGPGHLLLILRLLSWSWLYRDVTCSRGEICSLYSVELLTNFREVSQCPEKVPTGAFSLLKTYYHFHKEPTDKMAF